MARIDFNKALNEPLFDKKENMKGRPKEEPKEKTTLNSHGIKFYFKKKGKNE